MAQPASPAPSEDEIPDGAKAETTVSKDDVPLGSAPEQLGPAPEQLGPAPAQVAICGLCREEFSTIGMQGSPFCFVCATHARCACADPVGR